MLALAKLIITITLTLASEQAGTVPSNDVTVFPVVSNVLSMDSTQIKAFDILSNKCNICHQKRNKRRVFTQDNMNPWAQDVYKQVFIKRRMPKGKNIKLTNSEYQQLLTWITSTKNQY